MKSDVYSFFSFLLVFFRMSRLIMYIIEHWQLISSYTAERYQMAGIKPPHLPEPVSWLWGDSLLCASHGFSWTKCLAFLVYSTTYSSGA